MRSAFPSGTRFAIGRARDWDNVSCLRMRVGRPLGAVVLIVNATRDGYLSVELRVGRHTLGLDLS